MSTLFYTQHEAVPDDIAHVSSTVTVVEPDEPSAAETAAPGYNDVDTDPDTGGGLTRHTLGPHTVASERTVAGGMPTARPHVVLSDTLASAGPNAAIEASGKWGHGTLQWSESVEPAIGGLEAFNEHYFVGNPRPVQVSGDYMTATTTAEQAGRGSLQAAAEVNARQAVQASMYGAYLRAVTGA